MIRLSSVIMRGVRGVRGASSAQQKLMASSTLTMNRQQKFQQPSRPPTEDSALALPKQSFWNSGGCFFHMNSFIRSRPLQISARGFTSGKPKPNFCVITQTEFVEPEDLKMATWMNPIRFLKKHPAVLEAHRHNDLIPKGGDRPWMLSGSGRALWQSAMLLVFINKLRGHDISRGLFVENLQVSPSGSFRLKNPISDAWYKGKSFMGYKALAALFNALMKEIYGPSVVSELSADVEHWLSTLEGPLDDRLCLYHAALLSPSGRSMLSIRAHSLVRSEVNPEGFCWIRPQIYDFLLNLPYVSLDHMTDKMHVFFRHLRRKKAEAAAEAATKQLTKCSQEFDQDARKKSPTETPHELSNEEALRQAGFSVVALNRNAVMHRIWPDDVKTLVQDLPDAAVKEWYCLWEIVQLLHYYMPLYLPEVQRGAIKCRFWKYLEMGAFWPRDEMFHNGTPMRIGLADNMFGMLTYRSNNLQYLPSAL